MKTNKQIKKEENLSRLELIKERLGDKWTKKNEYWPNGYPFYDIEKYEPDCIALSFRDHDVSFEDLEWLSKTFNTKNINVGTENRDDGYCETCSSPYSVNVIYIKDWK